MRPLYPFIAAGLCLFLSLPALANDTVFPANSLIGLKPPGAMKAHVGLSMFEDEAEDAVISLFAEPNTGAHEQPFSEFGKIDKVPPDKTLEGPVQYWKLAEGIEAYLLVYTVNKGGKVQRHWTMAAQDADLLAILFARAPADSKVYSDALMQAALRTLQFRKAPPEE
ncbi:MAG: hypothetical protein ABJP02_02470 [Parasphingorhabdus sp.]|uniref:hypothetical protein n=1 Tax=Parasphingorhabdus sp. TaxID=2709688 RepID=UPI00329A56A7